MKKEQINTSLYKALKSSFEADRDSAVATLEVYFTNPVGVAEHPDFVNDLREYTKKLAEAEENIRVLEEYFWSRDGD